MIKRLSSQAEIDAIDASEPPFPGTEREAWDHSKRHCLERRSGERVVLRDHYWSIRVDDRWLDGMIFDSLENRPGGDPIFTFVSEARLIQYIPVDWDWERYMIAGEKISRLDDSQGSGKRLYHAQADKARTQGYDTFSKDHECFVRVMKRGWTGVPSEPLPADVMAANERYATWGSKNGGWALHDETGVWEEK